MTMRETAPAKLNLHLHITGKRAEGYHELQSLAVFLDVGDALEITAADALSLDIKGPFASALETTEDNLVFKAARRLHPTLGAAITLHKNLPVGAGLGGGSADAAAALRGLNTLWGLEQSVQQMSAAALPLGTDIPACIKSEALWMENLGEKLTPVQLPTLHLVLVNPLKPLATASVYQAYRGTFRTAETIPTFSNTEVLLQWLKARGNDLTAPAIALMPEIEGLLKAIEQSPNCQLARMSGSGATCFGVYATAEGAQKAAVSLKEKLPHCWVQAAKSL